jgi:hypothetical protein
MSIHQTLRLAVVLLGIIAVPVTRAGDDALAAWRTNVTRKLVAPDAAQHSIHAYFNTSPESPDGRYVLYYTSKTPTGEAGEIRILERAAGTETVIASGLTTEDAHRAACQQWLNGGKTIAYHDCVQGRWRVVAVDLATLKSTVLAEDRQLGFGVQLQPWAPIYGCHWNPGTHRDLELIDVNTGVVQRPVTIAQVVDTYGDLVARKFGTREISIFFPILSPDASKVFFKLSRPGGGNDFRSAQASFRDGKVVYDLEAQKFIRWIDQWGHPSWNPESTGIFEKGGFLMDVKTGKSVRYSPSSPSDHPSLSPDGRLFVTDADVTKRPFGKPGDWAVVVGDTKADAFVVAAQFNNTAGAKSWRRSHPHPAFSADGKRIYYNVSDGTWTRLYVAEAAR